MRSAPAWFGSTAILLATAPDERGAAAALLPYRGTLLGHLVADLAGHDVDVVVVLTRPQWRRACAAAVADVPVPVTVTDSPDLPTDLALVARLAGELAASTAGDMGGQPAAVNPRRLVLVGADLALSAAALGGLLADPRVTTGGMVAIDPPAGSWSPVRLARGRIVSAGSAFHVARRPNAVFAGVLVVSGGDLAELSRAAGELAALATEPLPPTWRQYRSAAPQRGDAADGNPGATGPAAADVLALLLVGLVRGNVQVASVSLRGFFLARPRSIAAARAAELAASGVDEDRVRLDAAVKDNDGFFTTFLVSPYSRYLARWAAGRGWTPNEVTTLSLAVGLLAAGAFAVGSRPGLVTGAVLLQAAFTADCVDGQLARYTMTFTGLGAWLDAIFDRAKEYAVYAGLAIGSARGFDDEVWLLAVAALAVQTVRHSADAAYAASQHLLIGATAHRPLGEPLDIDLAVDGEAEPDTRVVAETPPRAAPGAPAPHRLRVAAGAGAIRASRALERRGWMRYGKKILVLPIGERFALISITAALLTPRKTFTGLLSWGVVAAGYSLTGKVLRSMAQPDGPTRWTNAVAQPGGPARWPRDGGPVSPRSPLADYRDDGPLAAAFAGLAAGRFRIDPVVLTLAGVVPAAAVAALPGGGSRPALGAGVGWLVLCAAAPAGRPAGTPLGWLAPPLLRAVEYGLLIRFAVLDGARRRPAYGFLAAVAFHHYDVVYRVRARGSAPPDWVRLAAGGWDGRLLGAYALLVSGRLSRGLRVGALLLGGMFAAESSWSWFPGNRPGRARTGTDAGRAPAGRYQDDEADDE